MDLSSYAIVNTFSLTFSKTLTMQLVYGQQHLMHILKNVYSPCMLFITNEYYQHNNYLESLEYKLFGQD